MKNSGSREKTTQSTCLKLRVPTFPQKSFHFNIHSEILMRSPILHDLNEKYGLHTATLHYTTLLGRLQGDLQSTKLDT